MLAVLCGNAAWSATWSAEELEKFRDQKSEWVGNQLGKGGEVMPPWKPVGFSNGTVNTLMWDYRFEKTLLPTSMLYRKSEEILAGAPYLALAEGGSEHVFRDATVNGHCLSPEVAEVTTVSENHGVEARINARTEFDGMIKVTLTLSCKDPSRKFKGLRLVIPIKEEASSNYHYYIAGHHPVRPFNQSGNTPAAGFSLDTFRTLVWLGNTHMGLCFFAENIKGWPLKDEKGIEEVSAVKDGKRELTVRFANREFTLEKPLEIVFGLQATPAKERERDFRRRSDFLTRDWVWWYWSDGDAHPFDESPRARKYIEDARARGLEVIPYSSTHYYGVYYYAKGKFGETPHPGMLLPEIKLWGAEWQRKPLQDKSLIRLLAPRPDGRRYLDPKNPADDQAPGNAWQGKAYLPRQKVELCPNSEWQQFYLWRLKKTIDATGLRAIYLDSGINSCSNPAHGCGYLDYSGKWRDTSPIFATREMFKRMRRLFQESAGESRICLHTSCHLEVPVLSFVDSHLGAEQYAYEPFSVHEFYGELMTPEIMQAEHIGIPFGVAEEFLPVFNFFWRDYRAPSPASVRDLCGLSFVHDANPSAKDTPYNDLIRFYQSKRLAFFPECDKVACYWEKQNVFSTSPEHVKGIVHWSTEKGLVVLYNWSGKITHSTLVLNANAISRDKARLRLRDIVSGEEFKVVDGKAQIPLAPRDFRMFEIVK